MNNIMNRKMRLKEKTGMFSVMIKAFFILCITALLFYGTAAAEKGHGMKKHYKESLMQVTEDSLFSIEVMIPDKKLRIGTNRAELIIYDKTGNDVEDAEITLVPWIPGREQAEYNEPVIIEKGGGFYNADNIVLDSAGEWALRITIKKEGMEDTAIIPLPEIKETASADMPASTVQPKNYRTIFTPLPALPPIPADNSMTMEKIMLGKMLFQDRRLSGTGAASCVFCHDPAYYGAEPVKTSIGISGEMLMRNAPTVLNAAFLKALFWAGESPTLEHQALRAISSETAMQSLPDEAAERLNRIPEYRDLSIKVFGGPLTGENIGKALAAFMRTLITPDYPLAGWLQGDEDALSEKQKTGMALFVDKGCIGCHYGPVLSGPTSNPNKADNTAEHQEGEKAGLHLHKVMLPGAEDDTGLATMTGKDEDAYLFKVPLLLNVAETPPYSHAGIIYTLRDMVNLMARDMLNIELSPEEAQDIVAFLHSLTGKIPPDFMTAPLLPAGSSEGDFGPEFLPAEKR